MQDALRRCYAAGIVLVVIDAEHDRDVLVVGRGEMMTFFAPASRCAFALVASVKKPVDSTTMSTPSPPGQLWARIALGNRP